MRSGSPTLMLALAALLSGCPPTRPAVAAEQAAGPAGPLQAPQNAALWTALAGWTGRTPEVLQAEHAASGLRDTEDYAVTVVVALNLGVGLRELLAQTREQSLAESLRRKGFTGDTVRREIRRAEQQVRGWRRQPRAGA